MIKAIETRWKGTNVKGTEYDFYPGMRISYQVSLRQYDTNKGGEYINVFFNSNKCGHSNISNNTSNAVNGDPSDKDCIRVINIYQSQCKYVTLDSNDKEKHHSKLEADCRYYSSALKSIEVLCGTFAHEFGHVFGLNDAYPDVVKCDLLPQIESKYSTSKTVKDGTVSAGEIMRKNGTSNLNNIEMILYAKANGTFGSFTPDSNLSPAFKAPIIVYKKETELVDNYYYFETPNKRTTLIGDFAAYAEWLNNIKTEKPNWYKCVS